MEHSQSILLELKEISPLVAAIGKKMPYTVPAGYFSGLATQALLHIAVEEKTGADPVLHVSRENAYQLPEGYFDGLAANIINRIKASETTDAGEEINFLSPLLGKLDKQTPFAAPEGYFAEFSGNIVAGVKAVDFVNEELENFSPFMAALKDKQVYTVPPDYFETMPGLILQKAKQHLTPVVRINFRKRVIQYAAAAVIAGAALFSGYQYLFSNNASPALTAVAAAGDLSKASDQDLENLLTTNPTSLADIVTDADSTLTLVANSSAGQTDDAKDLLADISDEELQQYVDQRPETPISN